MQVTAASDLVNRLRRRLAEDGVRLKADIATDRLAGPHGWIVHIDLQSATGHLVPGPSLMVLSKPEGLFVTILDPGDYACPDEDRLAAYLLQRAEGVPPPRAARVLTPRKRWPWS